MIILPGMEIICKTIGDMTMNKIEKLRKNRETYLKKLDVAMEQCDPEFEKMSVDVRKSKNKFLSSWKSYKNHKISDQDFLQITDSFAQTLDSEKKMYAKFRKILGPLDSEFQKRCKKISDWEDNHD